MFDLSIFSIRKLESISVQDRINYIALFLFVFAAFYSIGHYKSDEHYQILEFAQFKLGQIDGNDLPWEFDGKMRPSLQPWLVVGMVSLFNSFNITNPFTITTIFRLITALLLWLTIKNINKVLIDKYFDEDRWAILFSCCTFFLWYVPFISVRFSSESYSSIFLLTALFFIIKDKKGMPNAIFIGLCLGISVLFKAQIGLAVLGIFAWLYFRKKENRLNLFSILTTFLLVTLLGTLLDSLFYQEFTFTPYNFIKGNLEGGRAAEFGTAPFYYYLLVFFMATIPPISLVLPLFFFSAIRKLKNRVIVWAIVPFILVHCIISHKEVRFLLAIHYLIIFLTIYRLAAYFKERKIKKYQHGLFKLAVVMNMLVLVYMSVKPANGKVLYQKYLYENIVLGNRTILTTKKDYYKIMGGLQTSFYRPENIQSYFVNSERDVMRFLQKNKINTCFYVHRGLSFSGSIPGYEIKKVYSLYPDWITKVPFLDILKIRTDCIYLINKL